MNFYSCLILITELLMTAMTLHVVGYSGFKRVQKAWYIITFVSIMLCAGAEFAIHGGYYDPSLSLFLTIIAVVQFSLAPLLGVFFSGALGLHHCGKIAIGYFLINLIVEAAAAPFGLVFYFDAAGYHRGEFFIIYEAFYVLSLVFLIVGMISVGKKFKHRDFWTIGMVVVILLAGILPMTFFKLNVTYIAIAISASLCYIYYNDLVQQDIQAELVENQKTISDMQANIISGLANLIENRDIETGEHIARTVDYVRIISENAKKDGVYADMLDDEFIMLMCRLAPLHDIGKIVVSDSLLKKPGRLTPEEFEHMKVHASVGGSVVRQVLNGVTDEEYLIFACDIATYHHERWDGTGYPKGMKGDEIPLSARIMAISDVFDALISKRCYKAEIPIDEAVEIIRSEAGSHFDPKLVEVFLRHEDEIRAAAEK
ncbi:MAG: HD domain-containing protein [Clostridia bacterium]|nr:HD domain-containing protein [Clostridia bacterium]